MPPRKRMRMSQAPASPSAESHASTADSKPTDDDILNDPWTDEEEVGLFKALIRWKPTGVDKDSRMQQMHEYLLDNHYIHPKNEHTKIPGIWQKLGTLYDLSALDEREDANEASEEEEEDEAAESSDAGEASATKGRSSRAKTRGTTRGRPKGRRR